MSNFKEHDRSKSFCLLCSLQALRVQYVSSTCALSPHSILSNLKCENSILHYNVTYINIIATVIIIIIALLPNWMPNTQEDAHELFVAMTTRLSYDLPRETGYDNTMLYSHKN